MTDKTVVLTFDDAVKNHLDFVAPLLKKYEFGATFFLCRAWTDSEFLSDDDCRALAAQGFEIGNHTWNHDNQPDQLEKMDRFFSELDLPRPIESFAYPGGPYAPHMVPALKALGIRYARTTEKRPWVFDSDDPLRIPSFPLQHDDQAAFLRAVSQCRAGNAVVLVFHGVPDVTHPWVTMSQKCFAEWMEYLHTNGFRCVSLREAEGGRRNV